MGVWAGWRGDVHRAGGRAGSSRLIVGAALALGMAAPTFAADPKPDAGAEHAADKEEKQICKKFLETGSLVRGYRVCKTKREWERDRDNIRSPAATSGGCNSANTGACGG